MGHIPGWYECPEFVPFKSPSTGKELWVLYGYYKGPLYFGEGKFESASSYLLGTFDGKSFTPLSEVKNAHLGPNYYAALTFVNAPEKNPVMMGWVRGPDYPGEPFNQCASVPLELSLQSIENEDLLHFYPIKNLEKLRDEPVLEMVNPSVNEANKRLGSLSKDLEYDVVMTLVSNSGSKMDIKIYDAHFQYSQESKKIELRGKHRNLHPSGTMEARFLIDRGVVESFWNKGEAAFCVAITHKRENSVIALSGDMEIEKLVVYPMKGIWPANH